MLRSNFIIFILFSYFAFGKTESLEDLQQKYVQIMTECSKIYPITANDLELLKRNDKYDNEVVNCFFACVYKSAGMMNDRGELWIEGVNEISRKYLSDDPVKMNKSVEFTKACQSVNNVQVKDGNRGCERAALIFRCTLEKASYFDFV